MAMSDDYSPLYVGDTLVPLTIQFLTKDGTAINLTGASLALIMESSTGMRQVGTGTWTIDNAAAGQAHYVWSSADVAVAGMWNIQVSITVGGQTEHCDPKSLVILPLL